jgi:hypothetical protein
MRAWSALWGIGLLSLASTQVFGQATSSSETARGIESYFQERQSPLWEHLSVPAGDRADYKRYDEALRKLRQSQLSDKAAADLLNRLLELRGIMNSNLSGSRRQRALQALQTLSTQGLNGAAAQSALSALGGELGLSASEMGGALASLGGLPSSLAENAAAAADFADSSALGSNPLSMASINPPQPLSADEEGLLTQPADSSWAASGFNPLSSPGSSTPGVLPEDDGSTASSSRSNSGRARPRFPGAEPLTQFTTPPATQIIHNTYNAGPSRPLPNAFSSISSLPMLHPRSSTGSTPAAKPFDVRELLGGDFARQAQQERRASAQSSFTRLGGSRGGALGQGLGPDCAKLTELSSDQVCKSCPSSDACACQKALDEGFAFKKDARTLGKALGKKVETVRLELLKKPLRPVAVVGDNLNDAQDRAVVDAAQQASNEQAQRQSEALLESSALLNATMGAQSPGCFLARDYSQPSKLPISEWLPEAGAEGCQRFDSADLKTWKSPADRARTLMFIKTMDEFLFAGKVGSVKVKNADFAISDQALAAPTHIPNLVDKVLLNKELYNSGKAGQPAGFNYMAKNLSECHGDQSWGKALESIEAELRSLAISCEVVEAIYMSRLKAPEGKPLICGYSSSNLSDVRRLILDEEPPAATTDPNNRIESWIKDGNPTGFRPDFAKSLGISDRSKSSCTRVEAHYQLVFQMLTHQSRTEPLCKKPAGHGGPREGHSS